MSMLKKLKLSSKNIIIPYHVLTVHVFLNLFLDNKNIHNLHKHNSSTKIDNEIQNFGIIRKRMYRGANIRCPQKKKG